ncbi:OmpA family protein [bacterium]|nr:OmpA family protein [bacterium]
MGLGARKTLPPESDNNIFWTTMSDLMLGLAIVFMTLFVLAMTGFSQQTVKQKVQQIEVNKELTEKLKQENIIVEIDELTGDVKISDLELFELGSATLSPKGRAYLDKFGPIYINTIFSNTEVINGIRNIEIQGHTDSHMFAGVKDPNEQYLLNMTLSLQRANAVAQYILKTKYDPKYNKKFKELMVVQGKSNSEPILVNGKEDYAKSRRVEMLLKTKQLDVVDVLFGGILHY